MTLNENGRAALVLLILITGIVVAGTNLFLYTDALQTFGTVEATLPLQEALLDAYAKDALVIRYLFGVPLALAGLLALFAGLSRSGAPAPTAAGETLKEAGPRIDPDASALRLLGFLQQEGRLIDFLEEDIAPYSDAQVGAAARAVHAGCRKAIHERMKLERLHSGEEGSRVEIPAGFDAAEIRLTGNVHGKPPFKGTLEHSGWKAVDVRLPQPTADLDSTIIAPAEVEIA